MRNKKSYGRRGNSFLNYNFTPKGGGSVTIGNGSAGSRSFIVPESGIPSEGGVSDVLGPGLKKTYLGPSKSEGGFIKEVPKIISGLIPGMPSHVPDITGIVKVATIVAGSVYIFRSSQK